MDISRDLGTSKFTWTDVTTAFSDTRTEYSRGSAATSIFTNVETAWKNGTITLAQSSAHTGITDTVSIWMSGNGAGSVGIFATLNGVVSTLALV